MSICIVILSSIFVGGPLVVVMQTSVNRLSNELRVSLSKEVKILTDSFLSSSTNTASLLQKTSLNDETIKENLMLLMHAQTQSSGIRYFNGSHLVEVLRPRVRTSENAHVLIVTEGNLDTQQLSIHQTNEEGELILVQTHNNFTDIDVPWFQNDDHDDDVDDHDDRKRSVQDDDDDDDEHSAAEEVEFSSWMPLVSRLETVAKLTIAAYSHRNSTFLSSEVTADHIGDFLEQVVVSENGFAFITDSSGNLLGSTMDEFYEEGGEESGEEGEEAGEEEEESDLEDRTDLLHHSQLISAADCDYMPLIHEAGAFIRNSFQTFLTPTQFSYNSAEKGEMLSMRFPITISEDEGIVWQLFVTISWWDLYYETFVGEMIAVGLALGSIVVVAFLSSILGCFCISLPLNRVIFLMEKVKRMDNNKKKYGRFSKFQSKSNIHSKSPISEMRLLSSTAHSMQNAIRSFRTYIPPIVVQEMLYTGRKAQLNMETVEGLTFLFTDLQNFTPQVDGLSKTPELVAHFLEEYFTLCFAIVEENDGIVISIQGDSIFAVFGYQKHMLKDSKGFSGENSALQAARTTWKMHEAINSNIQRWKDMFHMNAVTRFGLHTGEALVGNIGSQDRMFFNCLSTNINKASRFESHNKDAGTTILFSEEVYEEIRKEFICAPAAYLYLKGVSSQCVCYTMLAPNDSASTDSTEQRQAISLQNAMKALLEGQEDKAANIFQSLQKTYPENALMLSICESNLTKLK